MAESCPICAGFVGGPTPEWFDAEMASDFEKMPSLRQFCFDCIFGIVNKIPTADEDPYPRLRLVNEADVTAYAAEKLRDIAQRAGQGKSPYRCEALGGGGLYHWQQCTRFQNYETPEGKRLCTWCHKRALNGAELAFIGTGDEPPRPVVVWARNEEEAVERARRAWRRDYVSA